MPASAWSCPAWRPSAVAAMPPARGRPAWSPSSPAECRPARPFSAGKHCTATWSARVAENGGKREKKTRKINFHCCGNAAAVIKTAPAKRRHLFAAAHCALIFISDAQENPLCWPAKININYFLNKTFRPWRRGHVAEKILFAGARRRKKNPLCCRAQVRQQSSSPSPRCIFFFPHFPFSAAHARTVPVAVPPDC